MKTKLILISLLFAILISNVYATSELYYTNDNVEYTYVTQTMDIVSNLNTSHYISIGILAFVIILYLVVFFTYDKEFISNKYMYFRDIPQDLDAEIAEYIYSLKVSSKTIWATFLNLVHKGVYSIEKIENYVGTMTYSIKYLGNDKNLPSYEIEFIKWLNEHIDKQDGNIDLLTLNQRIKECSNSSFLKSFTGKIQSTKESLFDPTIKPGRALTKFLILIYILSLVSVIFLAKSIQEGIFAFFFAAFTSGIYSIFFSHLKESPNSAKLFIMIHYSAFQMGIFMMYMQADLLIMFVVYLLSYWLIFYSLKANKRSKSETEFMGKLRGLRKYLNHFSYISKRELDSTIVWGRYYAFAIALDVNKKNKNLLSSGIDSDIFDLNAQY